MARTKRASTRRTGTRKASTRKKPVRKTKGTRSSKAKGLRLTRKTQKQILIIVAVVVAILLLIVFLQNTPFKGGQKKAETGGEIGRNVVYGKVTSIAIGAARRGEIRVKSLNTGKNYTFYVGMRTGYSPRRYPARGERVKVYYVNDRGYLKATLVKLQ